MAYIRDDCIVGITDGDTVTPDTEHRRDSVCLQWIVGPESGQAFGGGIEVAPARTCLQPQSRD
jgi:hypothetical protein